eukprot:Sdes_comp20500_c0_seq4m14960
MVGGFFKLHTELVASNGSERDFLYYLCIGYFRIDELEKAKEYNELLLGQEPNNRQALSMKSILHDKIANEGLVGLAIVGTGALVAGTLVALAAQLFKKR